MRDGQLDVFRRHDQTPGLFDLESNLSFHAAKFEVQLVGVQELCVCEDSLQPVPRNDEIGNSAFTTYVHEAPKVAGFFDKGQIMELHHHNDWTPSCEEL